MRRSLILLSILFTVGSIRHNGARIPERRNRMLMMHRRLGNRDEVGQKVCFDLLGCFPERQQPLALKRPPQHPSIIDTRFYLFTRERRKEPDRLDYGDELRSMNRSSFNAKKKFKVIIHGYKGNGVNEESLVGIQAFLDLEDANVVVVDWGKGAGSAYGTAVSNTELVGRQLGLILLDATRMGLDPRDVHLIGFSLGAHVAGCASEVIKKHGMLIGRITGLDPASPFFRHHLFREKGRKLDSSDAKLVDVIHSDGSADFADGFGLLKPIGHIDFFPNGGRQQPGCNDVKNSVVVTHFNEDSLDIQIACSHARSWFLFVESMRSQLDGDNGCKFHSWPCKRRYGSFAEGSCFPPVDTIAAPEMGYAADRGGPAGQYYLTTRAENPFCGYPLRAAVKLAESEIAKPRGLVRLRAINGESITDFGIVCDQASLSPLSSLNNRNSNQPTFYDIKAADFDAFRVNTSDISVVIQFEALIPEDAQETVYLDTLYLDKITLEDRRGHRWEYCSNNFAVSTKGENVILKSQRCE